MKNVGFPIFTEIISIANFLKTFTCNKIVLYCFVIYFIGKMLLNNLVLQNLN